MESSEWFWLSEAGEIERALSSYYNIKIPLLLIAKSAECGCLSAGTAEVHDGYHKITHK